MVNKVVPVSSAVDFIQNGSTIAVCGFTLMGACETVLKEIEKRFLEQRAPSQLTLVHCAGHSDRVNGILHLAHPGLIRRIIGSHWGLAPKWGELILNNEVEAHCLPQGQMTHLFRAMASGKPGNFSKVGLGTFIDPRVEGGLMNEQAKQAGSLVEVVDIKGEEYLFYNAIPVDVAVIRGTTADEFGNVTMEDEAIKLEAISIAQTVKRYGGKVIVQVKHVARRGSLHPRQVVVPGIYVDAIVVAEDPVQEHRQTSCTFYDPVYSGDLKVADSALDPIPLTVRKIIGRRGVMELFPQAVVNLGTGIPGDTIGPVASEEGILREIILTVESGVIGGVPAGGTDFGIGKNAEAIIEHPYQFDYYNGAGIDITYMGIAEIDVMGNVNVSKFGTKAVGCGGFIDITQPAKKVCFLGTFTAGGLEVAIEDGKLKILQEGKNKKFLKQVKQITFSGKYARENQQPVFFVTERAVFKLHVDGVELVEYAPGVDIEKDIIGQMEFKPSISPNLKEMSHDIFKNQVMNFKQQFFNLR
ncbi:acyl CoA:acetate/3-ketoacid CoA transferase [Fodinisporobacter ferrooxydans]|uniref:Acyl CoA:acetate/3-ketoacid CoA transferase n=1 Tax=Fodinisporobacter ferrooxydans TaxID=2901836 RepID=A0ABY4CKF7_9BACL|nr:acyl CoA:acetate/3-ketoacid CoA transferase [Alicyclobacillaceae bacterium MYW30-H2]